MYIAKVRQRKAHMRAYMRRGRRGAVAHVKVTWHATAANQYRGTVGCVRSRGGSEKRRSSQYVRGRQPHLVEESSSRETRAHPRTHTYTDTHTHTHTPLAKHPVVVVRPVVSLSTRSACCGTADSSKEGSSQVQGTWVDSAGEFFFTLLVTEGK